MDIKLFDSELKVMDVLWQEGDITAKKISTILKDQVGWNVNTTYTLIKEKVLSNEENPNFFVMRSSQKSMYRSRRLHC